MRIEMSVEIAAPVEKLWKILGPEYAEVCAWASSVHSSTPRAGTRPDGAPVAGRLCKTDLGAFTESIVEYDDANLRLAYSATGVDLPFFVRKLLNRWTVVPLAGVRSRVDIVLDARLLFPFSWFMGWLLRRQMSNVLNELAEELKHFAETGEPHPRKIAAVQRAEASAGAAA